MGRGIRGFCSAAHIWHWNSLWKVFRPWSVYQNAFIVQGMKKFKASFMVLNVVNMPVHAFLPGGEGGGRIKEGDQSAFIVQSSGGASMWKGRGCSSGTFVFAFAWALAGLSVVIGSRCQRWGQNRGRRRGHWCWQSRATGMSIAAVRLLRRGYCQLLASSASLTARQQHVGRSANQEIPNFSPYSAILVS